MICHKTKLKIVRKHRSSIKISTSDHFYADPQPVQNLSVTEGNTELFASVDDHSEAVSYNWYLDGSFVASTSNSEYVFSGLEYETDYTVAASVVDADNLESELVSSSHTTLPPPIILFSASSGDNLSSINADTLQTVHTLAISGSRPQIHSVAYDPNNNRVYLAEDYRGYLFAYDVDEDWNMTLDWRVRPNTSGNYGCEVDEQGYIYTAHYNGSDYTVGKYDPSDGSNIWERVVGTSYIRMGITLSPEGLISCNNDYLDITDTDDGSLIRQINLHGGSTSGRRYYTQPRCSREGILYAATFSTYTTYQNHEIRKYDLATDTVLGVRNLGRRYEPHHVTMGYDHLFVHTNSHYSTSYNKVISLNDNLTVVAQDIPIYRTNDTDLGNHSFIDSQDRIFGRDIDNNGVYQRYDKDGNLEHSNNIGEALSRGWASNRGRPYPFQVD